VGLQSAQAMPTAYIFARLRSSTDTMPSLTVLQPSESRDGRRWARLSHFFPQPPHRLVQIEIGLDAHWMLHDDSMIFWDREQAEEALRKSAGTWASWSVGAEQARQLTWVNEVHGPCIALAKTAGNGAEARRWWAILEVHVPFAEGTRVQGP
jgi:hypothetical protein